MDQNLRLLTDELSTSDDVPKVSSDGEPHEVLTLVAVTLGIVMAVVVLSLLGCLIDCKQNKSKPSPATQKLSQNKSGNFRFRLFVDRKSIDITRNSSLKTISSKVNGDFMSAVSYVTENEKGNHHICGRGYFNQNCASELDDYVPGIKTIAL